MQSERTGDFMFVKVNMDGVPIGRKIDLNVYSDYDQLARVVEDMFKKFIAARRTGEKSTALTESNTPELLRREADYVLAYEDNDGDKMLVGDVPWEIFMATVKRLRIIRGSDAYELAAPRMDEVSDI
ncbi:auxin-responsive protein IAA26-like [Nymphaea colorata]|nr:auxin-responsive protein IAA26-like [Nymphaea colorata]XP_031495704.1 auxin-responsive protein IAA26-like [Nymphaea colorata]XP_031495705.1 auxin-responsive protein IAA26-like [Nymphaea colorata]XP_031495706.1 auxin-responsive protein IAA26-like [Nymphaea colorata]XP_031495707.1 auxin-responsive protein IAA26-like [Nymphaea colorata]